VLGRRYDVLGEAGRGAMGQVYKARDRETGEIVALKLLKPEIASLPGMAERFKSELLFARKITHKNVCRVYEFNRVDGFAYTSMEFVQGESLRSVLKRFGRLTPSKAIDLALQMCSGLKEAHAQGIVHRDLKPENVMIDVQGNVKVMDFGIARSMEALTLLTGSMMGTPAYMAPEQAAGKAVDYRADIYALGLILYEMFTGDLPFQADNPLALVVKHMQESPRPPREINPSISDAIERAILKCLEKEPDRRFQSISELEAALRSQVPASAADRSTVESPARTSNVTVGTAVAIAAPVSIDPPAQKMRRKGLVAAVLVAGLVALGTGIIWRAREPRDAGTVVLLSKDSASAVPKVSVATTPDSLSVTTNQPAKPETPTAPTPEKVTTPPDVDANVASSTTDRPASPISPPAPPIVKATPAAAETTPTNTAVVSSQNGPPTPGTPAGLPPAKGEGGFVFVTRFPHEVRAQHAAKKIKELNLPVSIVPKHNPETNEEFFVVLTGPFTAAKIDGIVQRLQENGFLQARPNKAVPNASVSLMNPPKNPKVFDDYVGSYQVGPRFMMTITQDNGHLFAQGTRQPKLELFPEGERNYLLKDVDARITFVTDRSGRATELILHQNGRDQHGRRIE
jgi:serine/threonine protein kinase